MHSDGNDLTVLEQTEVYATLAQLKQEGLIRAFGFSGKTVAGGLKALEEGDCAMVTYNLNEQGERPVLDYAAAHGKGILIKKALASGHACRPAQQVGQATSPDACLAGMDPVRASFELIFAHPAVSSAIVGTITPAHLANNVATVAALLKARQSA
ncbi:Aldo/keto reductase family protein [compost metagenome]